MYTTTWTLLALALVCVRTFTTPGEPCHRKLIRLLGNIHRKYDYVRAAFTGKNEPQLDALRKALLQARRLPLAPSLRPCGPERLDLE